MANYGKLYVFEGPDGVGKTTLSRWFARTLRGRGIRSVFWSSFPGNEKGSIGNVVYRLHHNPRDFGIRAICPLSLQLLHVAAHIDTIESRFNGLIPSGNTIVLDRFWWSTWVYGRATGADPTILDAIIALEKRIWNKIKPTKIFLVTRPTSTSSQAFRHVERLYASLARKEAGAVAIVKVNNNGSIREAQKQILSAL